MRAPQFITHNISNHYIVSIKLGHGLSTHHKRTLTNDPLKPEGNKRKPEGNTRKPEENTRKPE